MDFFPVSVEHNFSDTFLISQ